MILLSTACSNKTVPTSEYLLRPDPPIPEQDISASVMLGQIGVPPYLDQPGIVLEVAPNEINAARHHRWAEPLLYSLHRYLQVAISGASNMDIGGKLTAPGEIEKQIDVVIHQLHATSSGNVRMVAEWRIFDSRTNKELAHRDFTTVQALDSDGYPAVVRAHEALLNRLAIAIAEEL